METALPVKTKLFKTDYFNNHSPWYGLLVKRDDQRMILSSVLKTWPQNINLNLTTWIFNQEGKIILEKVLLENVLPAPKTIDINKEFPELPDFTGLIALIFTPADPAIKIPTHNSVWTTRILYQEGISDIVGTGTAKSINSPTSGKNFKYRSYSGALVLNDDWKPLACTMNVSAFPGYSKTVNYKITVYDRIGNSMEATNISLPPFGTGWFDIEEIFGDKLKEFLKNCNGRGAYMVTSDDAASIGYHFLIHRKTKRIIGDHTRPLLVNIPNCYGAGKFTYTKPQLKDFINHARYMLHLNRKVMQQ